MKQITLTELTIGQTVWLAASSGHLYRAHVEDHHEVEGLTVFITNGGWRGRLYRPQGSDMLAIQADSGSILHGISIRRVER